jgi:enoyl-CoA hydratase/carnithine racemase
MTATGSRPVVALREHVSRSGAVIGHAELDSPSTLNALSLEMVDALTPALTAWQQDERVACVLLTGAGDRAFCAGGDIQALYRAMLVNEAAGEPVDGYPDRFFEREYRLDYLLHTFHPVAQIRWRSAWSRVSQTHRHDRRGRVSFWL